MVETTQPNSTQAYLEATGGCEPLQRWAWGPVFDGEETRDQALHRIALTLKNDVRLRGPERYRKWREVTGLGRSQYYAYLTPLQSLSPPVGQTPDNHRTNVGHRRTSGGQQKPPTMPQDRSDHPRQ
jgi:hypothetical protein